MLNFILKMFVKDYKNIDDPSVRAKCGKLSGIVGVVSNLILFIAKILVGLLCGSISIIADAINNLSDASSSIITLVGFKLSAKPADEKHPYGYSRIEYLSGLIVAVIILAIGVELIKGSIEKIISPVGIDFSVFIIIVLSLSIVVKLFLAIFNYKLGKRIKSTTLQATATDSRNDVISTLSVLIGCIVSHYAHVNIDGIIGLLVAIFIIWSGIGIAKDTISPLLGEAPDEQLVHTIAKKILSTDKVLGIHDLILHDYGSFRRFASVHIEMDYHEDVLVAHEIIDNIEREIKQELNIELVAHYDPIVTDDEGLNFIKDDVAKILSEIDTRLNFHDLRIVRGVERANIIFDLVLPVDLEKKREEIKNTVSKRLENDDIEYMVVINFDSLAFNDPHAKKNSTEI